MEADILGVFQLNLEVIYLTNIDIKMKNACFILFLTENFLLRITIMQLLSMYTKMANMDFLTQRIRGILIILLGTKSHQ